MCPSVQLTHWKLCFIRLLSALHSDEEGHSLWICLQREDAEQPTQTFIIMRDQDQWEAHLRYSTFSQSIHTAAFTQESLTAVIQQPALRGMDSTALLMDRHLNQEYGTNLWCRIINYELCYYELIVFFFRFFFFSPLPRKVNLDSVPENLICNCKCTR